MINKAKNIYTYLKNHSKRIKASLEKSKRKKFEHQHQLTSTTWQNRYPAIFEATQKNATGKKNILSYGCSTGEECFSIRQYFPEAIITGADINEKNLLKARKKNNDSNISFINSDSKSLKTKGSFDIIFAMSVLCRWEDTKDIENCKNIYPFTKFDESINFLINLLNKDGLLVVYNSNFKVEDSTASTLVMPLEIDSILESGFVHKFDINNFRDISVHNKVIYKKL